jgi:TRAP transporter TAXI family solute receptor
MKRILICVGLALALLLGAVGADYTYAAEEKKILIAAGRETSPWYAIAQALAKFINTKSEWLRAEAVSNAGISACLEMVAEDPELYMGVGSFANIHHRSTDEFGRKRGGGYDGERFIANFMPSTECFVTYDPDIKTMADLAGKTVDVSRRGGGNTVDHKAILAKYGVLDKVKLVYTGFGGGANKLMDGLVDATMLIFDQIYPNTFSKGAFIEKLQTKGPVYYVGFDREAILELRSTGHGTVPVWVPDGALDPKTQPKGFWANNNPTYFMADEKMDPEIIYEVTRIIWETPAEEWAKWNPIGMNMNKKFKPAMPDLKLYKAHPGAQKFYDEHGIKLVDIAELLQK